MHRLSYSAVVSSAERCLDLSITVAAVEKYRFLAHSLSYDIRKPFHPGFVKALLCLINGEIRGSSIRTVSIVCVCLIPLTGGVWSLRNSVDSAILCLKTGYFLGR